MRKILRFSLVVLFLFVISACSSVKHPKIVNHKAPNLHVDTDWIEKAGCHLSNDYAGNYWGTCAPDSPLLSMGCQEIIVDDLLGGLPHPVVKCAIPELAEPSRAGFTHVGCALSGLNEALLTFKDGAYQIVGNDEIKSMTVPIESPDEALSYVLATTKYYTMYDIEIHSGYIYFISKIEASFVKQTRHGYLLHLFSGPEPQCGFGNHYTEAVDILVDNDGNIELVKSYLIYNFNGIIE
jgi:hypothetical protein